MFAAKAFGQELLGAIKTGDLAKARNRSQTGPLHIACGNGSPLALVRLLVENGADVQMAAKHQGTPLDIAAEQGDDSIIQYLMSQGARFTPLDFETVKLGDGLHRLAYPWGMGNNLVVFSGSDGIVIVDTGFSKRALDAIRKSPEGLQARTFAPRLARAGFLDPGHRPHPASRRPEIKERSIL
jgi:ankyrin repeat protein